MKIIGYTCTYNEADYIPYVMPYVEAMKYDKFIVYDNCSTDNTVELLSKYPFVEIRKWDTGGNFDDTAKKNLQMESFKEAYRMAKVGTKEEELVWMSWTDFDEVIFISAIGDFKQLISGDYNVRKYNAFYKPMLNLFCPNMITEEIKKEIKDKKFAHGISGVRGSVWCCKPLMWAVNDFSGVRFFEGNHYCVMKMREGRTLKNYDDICMLHAFHLKWFDKDVARKKFETYAERDGAGKDYERLIPDFDEMYLRGVSTSFPVENYFLGDFLQSKIYTHEVNFQGIMLLK